MSSTGTPKIGTTYAMALSAVTDGGKAYVAAATVSGLSPMLQVDRRYIPLAADTIFFLCVANAVPSLFIDFHGVLSATGTGQAKVAIPNLAPLVGVDVDACFVTYDLSGVGAVSNPWGFQITN
jgi:hypothetical protein